LQNVAATAEMPTWGVTCFIRTPKGSTWATTVSFITKSYLKRFSAP